MATITGTIDFSITTIEEITSEQFETFKTKIEALVTEWEDQILEAAEESDFEYEEIHPIILDELQSDLD